MKTISIISIIYGVLGLIWGTVIKVLVQIYSALIGNIELPQEANQFFDAQKLMETVSDIWSYLYPFILIIAVIYIVSGIVYLSKRRQYASIMLIAAILNIIWYVAYMVIVQTELMPLINNGELFPEKLFQLLVVVGMLFEAVFYCGYPIFLVIFLSRQRRS
jgi:hypothetical protein